MYICICIYIYICVWSCVPRTLRFKVCDRAFDADGSRFNSVVFFLRIVFVLCFVCVLCMFLIHISTATLEVEHI